MMKVLSDFGQNPISLAMASSSWVVPAMQSLHIMAIAVVFFSVLTVAMRLLGFAWAGQSVRQTADRFAPWILGALIVLAFTGLVLILAEPVRELMAVSFWLKMALLVLAIIISLRFTRSVRCSPVYQDQNGQADASTRRVTIVTVGVWIAIIFLGRFIAYDPLIWGRLSPLTVG
ncbi:MAG TPA: DUF6644 family protein [Rhizobiaceae bacterium]|nr:DUF6644 family protein [Rhizobiaceae bacterium]